MNCEPLNVLEIVLLGGQLISAIIIAAMTIKITNDFNNYQKEQMEQHYKPYLIITNLINNNYRKNRNDFKEIPNLPRISYDKLFGKKIYHNKVLVSSLFSHKGKNGNGSVYHMFYRGYRHLILNFLDNKDDIFFDLAPTIIVIKNIGFDLCSYLIKKVKIFYKDGAEKTLYTDGVEKTLYTDEEWQQIYVPSQESFYLLLSMATNKNLYTLCDVSGLKQEKILSKNRRIDLLRIDLSNSF